MFIGTRPEGWQIVEFSKIVCGQNILVRYWSNIGYGVWVALNTRTYLSVTNMFKLLKLKFENSVSNNEAFDVML